MSKITLLSEINDLSDTTSTIYSKHINDYPFLALRQSVFGKNTKYKKEDFIKEITKEFNNIELIDIEKSFNYFLIKNENFLIIIESFGRNKIKKYIMNVFLKEFEKESIIKLNDIFKKYLSGKDSNALAEIDNIFLDTQKEIKQTTSFKKASDFDYILDSLYPGIDIKKMVDSYINSNENILILTGSPGVGKTSLIKYIIKYFIEKEIDEFAEINIAYTKDENLVKEDAFWGLLQENNYKLLILDDFDKGLQPREDSSDGNAFVSKLLSFSDGIFNNNIKIIISTNRNIEAIDKAIIRPGRCFDVLKLRELKINEARDIWVNELNLSASMFEQKFGNNEEITQALFISEAQTLIKKEDDNNYLIEKELSIKKEFEKGYIKQRIGFNV